MPAIGELAPCDFEDSLFTGMKRAQHITGEFASRAKMIVQRVEGNRETSALFAINGDGKFDGFIVLIHRRVSSRR